MINDDLVLYPVFMKNAVIVQFDYTTNGGTSANIDSIAFAIGDSPINTSLYRAEKPDNWEFLGWTLTPGSYNVMLDPQFNPYTNNPNLQAGTTVKLYAVFRKQISLTFILDDSFDKAKRLEEVLNKVNISPLARSESLSVKQIIDIANNL